MTSREDNRQDKPVRIIACGVFSPVLQQLKLYKRFRGLNVTYLPSNLHNDPNELDNYLRSEFLASKNLNERIICLYGECFPAIDTVCRQYGLVR